MATTEPKATRDPSGDTNTGGGAGAKTGLGGREGHFEASGAVAGLGFLRISLVVELTPGSAGPGAAVVSSGDTGGGDPPGSKAGLGGKG